VQVDPIKPRLKAPGTKGLKLKYDEMPLNIAFEFNLRRYNLVNMIGVICFMLNLSAPLTLVTLASLPPTIIVSKAGAYTHPLFDSS
jgi:hypothetical protein